MSWSLYRWVWLLESPLSVGSTPAESLNRCRLYVSARALWGALTAELARQQASEFPNYRVVGDKLQQEVRFTYLFPAKQVEGKWHAWLPNYGKGRGLLWCRESDGTGASKLHERKFRRQIIWAWPGTAIDPSSDTAAEGSLRETECLNVRWRRDDGGGNSRVAMAGYVFLHNKSNLKELLDNLTYITVGGDTRYGYGRLRRIAMEPATKAFGKEVNLQKEDPMV